MKISTFHIEDRGTVVFWLVDDIFRADPRLDLLRPKPSIATIYPEQTAYPQYLL
jgi:hypothetical protein